MKSCSVFKTFCAMVIIALAATPASAASKRAPQFAGSELLKMCSSTYDTDYGYCGGYISAIANLMLSESIAEYRACRFEQVRSQQAIDIFRGYAELFPEMMSGEAATAVAASLSRAFPCTD